MCCSFFQAPESAFHVFIRKSIRGFSGTSFVAGYVLEYNDDAKPWSGCRPINSLKQEVIHSWAFLEDEIGGFQNLLSIGGEMPRLFGAADERCL